MKYNVLLSDEEIKLLKSSLARSSEWLKHDAWENAREAKRIERYAAEGIYSERDSKWHREQCCKRCSEIGQLSSVLSGLLEKLSLED